jgi:hypothetical protein
MESAALAPRKPVAAPDRSRLAPAGVAPHQQALSRSAHTAALDAAPARWSARHAGERVVI